MFRASCIVLSLLFCVFGAIACEKKGNPVNTPDTTYSVTGTVKNSEGIKESGVSVHLTGVGTDTTVVCEKGVYRFAGLHPGLYTIEVLSYPHHLFEPKSQQVDVRGDIAASEVIVVQESDFKGLYCICGKVTSDGSTPVMGVSVSFMEIATAGKAASCMASPYGYYSIFVPRGKRILVTPSKSGYDLTFTPPNIELLPDRDITICNFTAVNNGPPLHSVSGRLVDSSGACLSYDVRLVGNGEEYQFHFWELICGFTFPNLKDGTYHIIIESNDYYFNHFVFTPDSTMVTLSRVDGVRDGGTVTIPDFVGTDYTVYTASGYFYLSPTASWTYERTPEGGLAEEYRVSVAGSTMLDGLVYRVLSPAGPFGLTAFRIDGNSVYTMYKNERIEFLKFAVVPGTTWRLDMMSGGYTVTETFLGMETVSTPAGEFPGCLKYELRSDGQNSYQAYTFWFAKGAGMVRGETVIVNYGEVREHVVDALKSRTN